AHRNESGYLRTSSKTVSTATLHQPTSPYLRPPSPRGEGTRSGGRGSLMPEGLFADPASGPALASRGSRVSRRFLQQLPPGHGGPRHWRFGPPAAQGPRARLPGHDHWPLGRHGVTVNLQDQTRGMTVEVHDVRSDHHLPTKLPTRQATVAESVPD